VPIGRARVGQWAQRHRADAHGRLPGVRRVAVVGGSIGGLTAALVLRSIGCEVDVYERASAPLDGRGAGIVLHPETARWPTGPGGIPLERMSTPCRFLRYLARDGSVAYERPSDLRFTSWNTLYRALLGDFGEERYHRGAAAEAVAGDGVRLAGGGTVQADLVVAADGIDSTLRLRLLPDVRFRPAAYVGWRGVVDEEELPEETAAQLGGGITYHAAPGTHIVVYPIPDAGGEVAPGRRRANYVWYRNLDAAGLDALLGDGEGGRRLSLPPGGVSEADAEGLRAAAADVLPPRLAEVVAATRQPFVQAIGDLESPRMALGRVAILGDAAFVARPHAAAGTAKACADAWALGEALAAAEGDVARALGAWEPDRLDVGRRLVARAARNGDRSQFGGGWTPGDPSLAFGLYRPGDSEGGW
jgi:2,6-dihydroxypyridine 3-monooxygenase